MSGAEAEDQVPPRVGRAAKEEHSVLREGADRGPAFPFEVEGNSSWRGKEGLKRRSRENNPGGRGRTRGRRRRYGAML